MRGSVFSVVFFAWVALSLSRGVGGVGGFSTSLVACVPSLVGVFSAEVAQSLSQECVVLEVYKYMRIYLYNALWLWCF